MPEEHIGFVVSKRTVPVSFRFCFSNLPKVKLPSYTVLLAFVLVVGVKVIFHFMKYFSKYEKFVLLVNGYHY